MINPYGQPLRLAVRMGDYSIILWDQFQFQFYLKSKSIQIKSNPIQSNQMQFNQLQCKCKFQIPKRATARVARTDGIFLLSVIGK
jgi:hypothetical protein